MTRGLARDGGGSVTGDVGWADVIASRLAPTGFASCMKIEYTANPMVGASLLAMAVGRLAAMLDVPMSSRAGSLPQVLCRA
ncbi:hypothetical protein AXG94_15010 [Pseudomonas corrugata]|nr:hypothetical protein AXG94_15010 [Pseudomonas corrugata]